MAPYFREAFSNMLMGMVFLDRTIVSRLNARVPGPYAIEWAFFFENNWSFRMKSEMILFKMVFLKKAVPFLNKFFERNWKCYFIIRNGSKNKVRQKITHFWEGIAKNLHLVLNPPLCVRPCHFFEIYFRRAKAKGKLNISRQSLL